MVLGIWKVKQCLSAEHRLANRDVRPRSKKKIFNFKV